MRIECVNVGKARSLEGESFQGMLPCLLVLRVESGLQGYLS